MREMKDSGVEWIGTVPKNWNIFRNKNAFDCSKDIVGEKSSVVQLLSLTTKGIKKKDITNTEGKLPETFDTYQMVRKNDLVMCLFDLDMSAVFSGISPYSGMISPAYRILTCTERIYPKYADYWFQYVSHGRKFNHYAKNIRYTLGIDEFFALPMLFPPVTEQRKIADYLDDKCSKIDAIIAKQEKIIEKLKEYRLALILETVTKGTNENIAYKECNVEWMKKIPAQWDIATIARIATVVRGASPRPAGDPRYFNGHDVPWITVAEVTRDVGKYIYETESFLTSDGAKLSRFVEEGTLLLSNSGATLGVPKITKIAGCINDGSVAFYNLKIDKEYLFYVLASRTIELRKQMQGYGQPNLNTTIVKAIEVPIPTREEQKRIVVFLDQKCESVDKQVACREQLISKLTEYKKSLIYECVTGKKEII